MVSHSIRGRVAKTTRTRIAEAALELFASQGFAETTIDQIAVAAGVARRTIFHHFATKEAMVFDHFLVRRHAAVELMRDRPADEPGLVSLHAVLREFCVRGYDRSALARMRQVLERNPELVGAEIAGGMHALHDDLVAALRSRLGEQASELEIQALTFMATSWVDAATCIYLNERTRSLVHCFDEAVAVSRRAVDELAVRLDAPGVARKRPAGRRSRR